MGWLNLLLKDMREHGLAFISLAMGFLLVVLMALVQQLSGEFNMSIFEVIRFSLITIIPLVAFIAGNRLIVREYTGGTRRFVEALPISRFAPLLVKYFIGLVYIVSLCMLVVLMTAGMAGEAEDVNAAYVKLLLIKTVVIGVLFWSVVFFVSFTGRIRLVIYVVLGLAVSFMGSTPGFDETRFAPMALMDRQLFIFERDIFPTKDIVGSLLLALAFVVAGFSLALVNDGSFAEQLGKPVSRRDIAAFALLGLGCLTVYTTLQRKWDVETYEISGSSVLRLDTPAIAISYIEPNNQPQAEAIFNTLEDNLNRFQADVGLAEVPQVQIALSTELEHTEIEPELVSGVLVSADYRDYGTYEFGQLQSIVMHHLLLSLTNARWDFETSHWLLDGLARWWAEGAENATNSENNNELFARAVLVKSHFDSNANPLLVWQTITDQYGFEGAEALAYSAIVYLQEAMGKDAVVELAASYINEDFGDSSIESLKRLLVGDESRFEKITKVSLWEFTENWFVWLDAIAERPEVARFVESVPKLNVFIESVSVDRGAQRLEVRYEAMDLQSDIEPVSTTDTNSALSTTDGLCVLRHQIASAFDQETMIYERNRDRQPCTIGGVAHSIDSPYAPGDRAYVLVEYENALFHRPVPLAVRRLNIK